MARVECSNADVFLKENASIFMWHQSKGLIYSHPVKNSDSYAVYVNGKKKIDSLACNTPGLITHPHIFKALGLGSYGDCDHIESRANKLDNYIRGRISPNFATIYVHDLHQRSHAGITQKEYEYRVNKTINAVYKYMDKLLK